MSAGTPAALPADVRVIERGWLSSNSTLLLGDPRGAVLVDTGYCTHKAQTLALVEEALNAEAQPPRLILNTHLHSDHCGGNASLAAAYGCEIWVPPGHFQAAREWDQQQLSYATTGQQCERFMPSRALQPGSVLEQAGRQWQVLAAPGHDPHSIVLFEPDSGVLISADALWEHGFGIVFPEIEGGSAGFDEVEATLELISKLPVRHVIPGHGAVFSDVARAVSEARDRLAFFRENPERHARHAAKALIKYHLLEIERQPLDALLAWLANIQIHRGIWEKFFNSTSSLDDWSEALIRDLQVAGVLAVRDGWVSNS